MTPVDVERLKIIPQIDRLTYGELEQVALNAIYSKQKAEAEVHRLRGLVQMIRDDFKSRANSEGGLVARIDRELARAEEETK
jgi:hypothetical protein